ncbi:hypothetical protein Dda_6230 [Drechslerella dactyloides]|uniref:Uncharacterized protein n=1 Tax=Drechslerella dactyloides TaxID=74499 RepID=A0AAD6NID1_DREDA|nr:hypothetical protein Dda_6230 [Drechslerella dactyloides]
MANRHQRSFSPARHSRNRPARRSPQAISTSPVETPAITLTVRGVRLVNREYSVRHYNTVVVLTHIHPTHLEADAQAMLRDGAAGVYDRDTGRYISLQNFYLLRQDFERTAVPTHNVRNTSANKERTESGSNQRCLPWNWSEGGKTGSEHDNATVIWDAVYYRPSGDRNADGEKVGTVRTALRESRRCASLLWQDTYFYPCVKRPLIYLEDLRAGYYAPSWRTRARKKVEEVYLARSELVMVSGLSWRWSVDVHYMFAGLFFSATQIDSRKLAANWPPCWALVMLFPSHVFFFCLRLLALVLSTMLQQVESSKDRRMAVHSPASLASLTAAVDGFLPVDGFSFHSPTPRAPLPVWVLADEEEDDWLADLPAPTRDTASDWSWSPSLESGWSWPPSPGSDWYWPAFTSPVRGLDPIAIVVPAPQVDSRRPCRCRCPSAFRCCRLRLFRRFCRCPPSPPLSINSSLVGVPSAGVERRPSRWAALRGAIARWTGWRRRRSPVPAPDCRPFTGEHAVSLAVWLTTQAASMIPAGHNYTRLGSSPPSTPSPRPSPPPRPSQPQPTFADLAGGPTWPPTVCLLRRMPRVRTERAGNTPSPSLDPRTRIATPSPTVTFNPVVTVWPAPELRVAFDPVVAIIPPPPPPSDASDGESGSSTLVDTSDSSSGTLVGDGDGDGDAAPDVGRNSVVDGPNDGPVPSAAPGPSNVPVPADDDSTWPDDNGSSSSSSSSDTASAVASDGEGCALPSTCSSGSSDATYTDTNTDYSRPPTPENHNGEEEEPVDPDNVFDFTLDEDDEYFGFDEAGYGLVRRWVEPRPRRRRRQPPPS